MRFIFDLDHTVIDSSHRQVTLADGSLDLNAWRENSTYDQIMRDKPLPLMAECRKLIEGFHDVISCTARVMGGADYQYLREYGLAFDDILSRPEGCDMPDAQLKEWLLRSYAQESGETFYRFARRSILLDDNEKVLKHLQGLGFRCYNAISINAQLKAA